MKVSNVLVAGVALTAGAEAFTFPSWFANLMSAMQAARPSFQAPAYSQYGYGGEAYYPSSSSSSSKSSSSSSAVKASTSTGFVNPYASYTKTGVATAYGTFAAGNNIPPTAPAYKPQSTTVTPSASSSSKSTTIISSVGLNSTTNGTTTSSSAISVATTNSTTNSSIITCASDAKANPNAAHDATHRCNWLPGYDINTDTESSWPNTGNVVKYTLTITNGTIAPVGDNKIGFLINGQFPGPKIEANWGDKLEITVINNLQNNGTSVHFHGLTQNGYNDADGVGGVTQCPIAPGQSYTYKFQATQYGTAWYHSHFTGQYGDGVLGPIIINGPTSLNYDIDLGHMMISDYFSLTAFQEYYLATRFGPQAAANYLINGKNVKLDGSGGQRTSFTFTPGKRHKFHVINTSVDHHLKLQIDGHTLIVVGMDLNPIEPYRTTELSLSVGQRYDIIVEANATPGNYWLRALFANTCAKGANDGTGSIANGIITYSNAPNALPTSQMGIAHSNECTDEPSSYLKPIVAKSVDSAAFASASVSLGIEGQTLTSSKETLFTWTLGGVSLVVDWANPTLGNAVVNANTYDATKHVVTLNNANAWTYWVFQNAFEMSHPMHVHGHDFRLLGSGSGTFSASGMISSLNFVNPPRRDTVQVTRSGWVVVAFKTDNPGAWAMHCHMAWHASGGLALQYLERPSEIAGLYGNSVNSQQYQNACSTWKTYYTNSVYKQEDSGLKRRELINGIEMDVEVLEELPERREVEVSKRHAAHLRKHVSHWGTQAL